MSQKVQVNPLYEECATEDDLDPDPTGVYSRSVDPVYLNSFDMKTLNVFYWLLRNDQGGGLPNYITTDTFLTAHETLNEAYSEFNICFNMKGYDTIHSSQYSLITSDQFGSLVSFAQNNGKYKYDAVNVYLTTTSGFAGIGPAFAIGVSSWTFRDDPSQQVLIHEMGHHLGLRHTHSGWQNSNCERVTRDEYLLDGTENPDYNANTNGDRIYDTAAVPDFKKEQHGYITKTLKGTPYEGDTSDILTNGFSLHPNAAAIENYLISYGFTQQEVNNIKQNGATSRAYIDNNACTYTGAVRPNSDMFKDCGGTPYEIFEEDVRNYMAYTATSCRNTFTTGQGIRIHEKIENPNNANTPLVNALADFPLDLYIRDHEGDIGQEPNIHTDIFWNSPDIWVRNAPDDGTQHQNPSYNANPNYVYVRVSNKGCTPSLGTEELELYWAKADTGSGNSIWSGSVTGGPNNIPLGGPVGSLTLPVIDPGDETVMRFTWQTPNPADFAGITDKDWHFCLLTRMVAPNDPMTFPNYAWSTRYNNNNASKNVTVISLTGSGTNPRPGGAVSIGNAGIEAQQIFDFEFLSLDELSPIFHEAEVIVTLDEDAYGRWVAGGRQAVNIMLYREEERQFLITGNNARLQNILYEAEAWSTLYLSFNFLTEEVTGKDTFEYHLIQRDAQTGEPIGGEVYQIIRDPYRPHFAAEVDVQENITGESEMVAIDIGESAVYNWYNPQGGLIHSGKEFIFTPEVPGDYLLEVIAEVDGHKDYFKLTIAVNETQDHLTSLSPNPASNTVEAQYQISQNATTASLDVVSFFGSTSNSYPIDLNNPNNTLNINLAGYPPGHYAVVLIVDGQAVHAKQLIIN